MVKPVKVGCSQITIGILISLVIEIVLIILGYDVLGIVISTAITIIVFIIGGWKTDLFNPDDLDDTLNKGYKTKSNNNEKRNDRSEES